MDDWKRIAEGFMEKWNFPHALGALDDIGGRGAASDAQLWNASDLKSAIEDGDLDLPDAEPLPHDTEDIPYFYIGKCTTLKMVRSGK
ncbi:Hypothetical predicted protein [Mytilus galloprovincialis]|uniref:Uncharacterized protein n=1 Tax=Mytilus galloprovincialis TaxID=29158 RepID=A0A8B6BR22_MYTGA|nr:Hypothetical predicted protein [Mytilus galloprovincialis]